MLKAIALATLLVTTAASASEMFLFERNDFRGQQFPAADSFQGFSYTPNSDIAGRAASARIRTGRWQLCSEVNFGGRCVTLEPGDYPSLGNVGLGSGVASARNLGDWSGSGGSGGGSGPGWGQGGSAPGWGQGGGSGARGAVVLYDRGGFGGREFGVQGEVRNLERAGFNDRARSMIVYEGTWELCGDADFNGKCQAYGPGRYSDLGRLDGRVSSLRRARGGGSGGGGWQGGGGGGWQGGGGSGGRGNRAVLYQGPNLTGRTFVVDRYAANLGGTGFNDRAQSLRVERGYWVFCSDADFRGECRTFGPGDYPRLPPGLENRISSGRKISDDYPYRGNPDWNRR